MKTRKKRIIRSLELDEISAVHTPAQSGALHAITKSEPEPAPRELILTPIEKEKLDVWAETYWKTIKQNQELTKMNKPQTTADIIKAYQDRHDVDHGTAFNAVMNRPEFAAAYEYENRTGHIQRQVDQRVRNYGS